MAFSLNTAEKNTMLNSIATEFNNGYIYIYAGTVPANAAAGIGDATVLASITLPSTAFASASGGILTANAITQQNATASGTATFYRALKSDASTVICQGSVGTSGAELNINTTTIAASGPVSINAFTISL